MGAPAIVATGGRADAVAAGARAAYARGMRWWIGMLAGLVAGLVVTPRDAAACDRAPSPLEVAAVGVAAADVAIVGEVTAIVGDRATVTVERAYKGATAVGASLEIRGVTAASDTTRVCGYRGLATGDRKVFLLWQPAGQLREHWLIDPMGGIDDLDGASDKKYGDALAASWPRSPWTLAGGLQTMLLAAPDPAGTREVDLIVLVRNAGAKPRRWTYRSWPRAAQSRCALAITNLATGAPLAPRPVPISARDIRAYFTHHGPRFDAPLAPGATQLFRLDRVTTAAPGWGYKERLGFTFYPVATPGAHSVAATCHNLLGRRSTLTTGAAQLVL